LLEFLVVIALVIIIAAVVFPLFVSVNPGYGWQCHSNLKELATSFQMYLSDYDNVLPSSALHQSAGNRIWDPVRSAEFCCQRGPIPPPTSLKLEDVHWVQLLWPHMKNKDIIWCPKDENRETYAKSQDPSANQAMVSYIYKPAVDCAWFDSPYPSDPDDPRSPLKLMHFRRMEDFAFPADQMIFFEHTSRHWGDKSKSWNNDVRINAAYLDGHVRAVPLHNAIGCSVPTNASELAMRTSLPGEPIWFNSKNDSPKTVRTGKERWSDPRVCYDDLP
jgi:prepilin-type processing-associated H-X9-DG protein